LSLALWQFVFIFYQALQIYACKLMPGE